MVSFHYLYCRYPNLSRAYLFSCFTLTCTNILYKDAHATFKGMHMHNDVNIEMFVGVMYTRREACAHFAESMRLKSPRE